MLVALTLCAAGCGGAGGPLWPRPAEPLTASPVLPRAPELLDSGLRVARVAGSDPATYEAALLVAAGPLDDPADRPGLTEWLVEAALLGSRGDPDSQTPPQRRALELGGSLLAVSTGQLAGWVVTGPAAREAELSALLADVALRPSFPPTRMQLRAAQLRDHLEEQDSAGAQRAAALAAGMALGLGRPVALAPDPALFDQLNREDVRRHWKRIV